MRSPIATLVVITNAITPELIVRSKGCVCAARPHIGISRGA